MARPCLVIFIRTNGRYPMKDAHILNVFEQPLALGPSALETNEPPLNSDANCMEKLERALALDNKHDFVELINNMPSDFLNENLYEILDLIYGLDSVDCAASVLDGETALTKVVDVNAWLSELESGPLFRAATYECCFITALLLQRGFSANARGVSTLTCHSGTTTYVLPLVVACAQVRSGLNNQTGKFNHCDGSLERRSPPYVLRELCGDMWRYRLEVLRLFCENTNTRDVKQEFFNYLKEGKMYEVAALLMVAKSRVLSSSTVEVEGEFQSISEMHDFLLKAKRHLFVDAENNKDKVVGIEETLVLLEIFDKIGDKLATLLRLDFWKQTGFRNCSTLVAESLIESAGYEVKPKCIYYHYEGSPGGGFMGDRYDMETLHAKSGRLKNGIDECKKKFHSTDDVFPSWVKETALRGLDEMLRNKSRLERNVPLPLPLALASRSAVPMPENLAPLHHLLKKTFPILGAIKRVLRLA